MYSDAIVSSVASWRLASFTTDTAFAFITSTSRRCRSAVVSAASPAAAAALLAPAASTACLVVSCDMVAQRGRVRAQAAVVA